MPAWERKLKSQLLESLQNKKRNFFAYCEPTTPHKRWFLEPVAQTPLHELSDMGKIELAIEGGRDGLQLD